jgi:hypothetical protein
MTVAEVLLDPTDEREIVGRARCPRPPRVGGTVALLDIAKPRGDVFLDHLEALLRQRRPGIEVVRYSKPTFTKPAPDPLLGAIAERAGAVIEALAD